MSDNWMFCDGNGRDAVPSAPRVSRRTFVRGATSMALATWLGRSALYDAVLAAPGSDGKPHDVLVTLFLRGGADGLSLAPPHGDDDYYRLRPTLALARPNDARVVAGNRCLALDDFFGLHPALSGLYPLYRDGSMAVLHAVGSGDKTRSHFEAMATMEYGMQNESASSRGGWVARHLNHNAPEDASPLRAVAFANTLPDILRGAVSASAVATLDDFRLEVSRTEDAKITAGLAALYRQGNDPITRAGYQTLSVLDTLKKIDPAHYQPLNAAKYPESDLGKGLRQVACLIRAGVGLEVACLDRGGWDTHVAQGTTNGWFALQLKDVGDSLAAFAQDLGKDGMEHVSVVVMTEFGRRAQENSGLGTDHGRAGAMLLLGGGINGGKVYAQWPGLAADRLEDTLDLKVTMDYRLPLGEIIAKRLGGASHMPLVFPNSSAPFLDVAKPA